MSDRKHEANRESIDELSTTNPTSSGLIDDTAAASSDEQVDHGSNISDSGGRNRGDNHYYNQDKKAHFHKSGSSRQGQVHLDATVDLCEKADDNQLRNSSMVASCDELEVGDDFPTGNLKLGAGFSPAQKFEHEPTRHQHVVGDKKDERSSSPIGRSKVNFNSDPNNNNLDGGIDSNDISNYSNKEKEEGDGTFSSSSDISDVRLSSTTYTTTPSTLLSDNQTGYDNTINHSTASSVRRRQTGNRAHEESDSVDLISEAAPKKLNWDEQQRYKKLKIMKADGSQRATSKSHNLQAASAYFCRLSRDDFGTASGCPPPPQPPANKSSQSAVFKCNNSKVTPNDGSILNKSLSCVRNIFTISHFQQVDSDTPSKLKQSDEIKLQNRKKSREDVIGKEFIDTSSVTDEDKSPEMTVNSKSGYKTFKGPERRLSRSKRNQSGESQRRLSQTSGYSKLDHHHYQTENKHSLVQELKRIALLLVIILISCFLLWEVYRLLLGSYNYLGVVKTPSILGEYSKYAVSTDAQPCAKVGSDLLAIGGSAVDAAIGTLLCMGVILPNSLGLGGGCLMTIYDAKKKKAIVVDGRETAPDYAEEHMFANDSLMASRGPLSIGVPGELSAYWKAHQLYGKLEWSHLFNDSIRFAEEGHPMVEHLANALRNNNHAKYMSPSLSKLFINPQEARYYKQGEVFAQPALAKTLMRIRDNGADEFYKGQTGQQFIQDLKDQGGKMTLTDLMKYEALIRAPLEVKLAEDLVLHTQPPPGSGVVLSIILRVMHKLGYYKNLKPQASFEEAALYYHRLAESFKFAYGQRAGLEDKPDNPERMKQLMEKLLSEEFIKEIVSKVDKKTHDNAYYGGLEYFHDDHGTAHVSVLDAEGNAAAVSTSVNLYFGAGMYSPSTGITYNDVMDDFVSPHLVNKFGLAPSKYNRIRPGKRPLSSMVPSVFTGSDGRVKLVLGGAGGTMITTGVAMVSLRNCFLGEDIKSSIDGPRIHHQFLPNKLLYEVNFPKDLVQSLHEIRNHTVEPIVGRSSIVMAVASEQTGANKTRIVANSDYRKGGSVHGQ